MEKRKLPVNTILGVVLKSSKLVKFVKLLKLAKYTKYLVTAITMMLSALVYGWKFGIWFGIGLVALIFFHEMGHVWAMKRKGYPTKAPVFIPLIGAVIFAPKIDSREDESYIGFMGPFIGSLSTLLLFLVWLILQSKPEVLILLVYLGVWINLFNLIPIRPLDGGRVLQSTGTWYKWIGLGIIISLIILMQAPQFIVILILCIDDFIKKIKDRIIIRGVLVGCLILGYLIGPGFVMEFWFDLVLASMFFGIDLIFSWNKINTQVLEEKDTRPFPDKYEKIGWMIKFFLLGAILIASMIYLMPYMPDMKK